MAASSSALKQPSETQAWKQLKIFSWVKRGRRCYHHLLVVGEGDEETVHVLEHLAGASLHVVDLGFSLLVEDGHLGNRETT